RGSPRRLMTIDALGGMALSTRTNRLLVSQNTSDVDIHRVDLSTDGTQAQWIGPMIVSSGYDAYRVYSPNGERIAFGSTRSGEWQVWAADKDGTNSIQLTSLEGAEAHPTAWKPPTGRQIGLVHNRDDGLMRAYELDATGGIPHRVP